MAGVNMNWFVRIAQARPGRERERVKAMTGEQKLLWRLDVCSKFARKSDSWHTIGKSWGRPVLFHKGRKP